MRVMWLYHSMECKLIASTSHLRVIKLSTVLLSLWRDPPLIYSFSYSLSGGFTKFDLHIGQTKSHSLEITFWSSFLCEYFKHYIFQVTCSSKREKKMDNGIEQFFCEIQRIIWNINPISLKMDTKVIFKIHSSYSDPLHNLSSPLEVKDVNKAYKQQSVFLWIDRLFWRIWQNTAGLCTV